MAKMVGYACSIRLSWLNEAVRMLKEEMDPDTSYAAGVAEFGMLLRGSEYSGTASYQEIYDRLKVLPGVMDDEFKTEFLYMVQKVSK